METELYIDRAQASLDRGVEGFTGDTFPSKAAQKRVLDDLNRAYDYARQAVFNLVLTTAPEFTGSVEDCYKLRSAYLDEHDMPFDLYRTKEEHVVIAAKFSDVAAEIIRTARRFRAEVKACAIVPPVKADATVKEAEARVQRTVRGEMDRLGKMYQEALDLGRLFGGLNVSANVHLVTNAYGTTFVRAFYYLEGKRTPLNLILAAADTLAREKEASA